MAVLPTEPGATFHCRPIPHGYAVVMVDEVIENDTLVAPDLRLDDSSCPEAPNVFDWMINDNGKVKGAFTIRVNRSRLKTDSEKLEFDEYIGISEYEPIR